MAIRYNPELNSKIRRIVKNYNAKVDRANAAELKRVPDRLTTKQLKSAYKTRADLERRLNQLAKFNMEKTKDIVKVGAENMRLSRWEWESLNKNRYTTIRKVEAELNRQRKVDRMRRRILPSEHTRQLKTTLKALKVQPATASFKQLRKLKAIVDRYGERRVETDQQFYENFFDMLWSSVPYVDADEETIQFIHDTLEQLTPQQLLDMYHNEQDIKDIVEDYNKYIDTQGYAIDDAEAESKNQALEDLADILPALVEKYKKK